MFRHLLAANPCILSNMIRGVNLGGWLVLEPWITPSLFEGTTAMDEHSLCKFGSAEHKARLRRHRQMFITEKDFQWLAKHGIEAVRIPVGYWIFGKAMPYIGAIKYLDSAFEWAEKHGLKIIICLHGAPGSQNGEMHSGQIRDVGWPLKQRNLDWTLDVIERLAKRYCGRPALLGIELLNEPAQEILRRILTRYYRQAYKIIRRVCGPDVWVIIDDRFKPGRWWWVLAGPWRRRGVQDHHHYQIFEPEDRTLDIEGHLRKAARMGNVLRRITIFRRIIVGEWSGALHRQVVEDMGDARGRQIYQDYTAAQLAAFAGCTGWFYWTYKTESTEFDPWHFRMMVEQGTMKL